MKKYVKYVSLILCCFMLANTAFAACNGGKLVTAHTSASNSRCGTTKCNGKTFCVSDNVMNWWSAMAWCRANGMQLVSFDNLCPNTEKKDGSCENWRDKAGCAWTRTTTSSGASMYIRGDGYCTPWSRNYTDAWGGIHAVCE